MNLLYVTNGAAVGIFGMVLSGAFCDIHWTKEKREFLVGSMSRQRIRYQLTSNASKKAEWVTEILKKQENP